MALSGLVLLTIVYFMAHDFAFNLNYVKTQWITQQLYWLFCIYIWVLLSGILCIMLQNIVPLV